PTCTDEDVNAAKALKDIADVDLDAYGLDMLKAGASTTDKSADVLLDMDAKSFTMGDYVTRIAQVNTVDIDEVLDRKEELEKSMLESSAEEKYDLFVLVVTDIINSDSKILVVGAEKDKVGEAFNVKLEDDMAFLTGVVSRKKQVVPQITEALTK
ncbi:MAG: DHHA2 domain-containing protein, partial [Staphylococcus warneri]|nr:DHHA2 domain-containing protein [Staphylococcus warneri]